MYIVFTGDITFDVHLILSIYKAFFICLENGVPEPIRTADIFLRREALYPAELRGHQAQLYPEFSWLTYKNFLNNILRGLELRAVFYIIALNGVYK